MKTIRIFLIVSFSILINGIGVLNAQEYKIPAPTGDGSKIVIKGFSGELKIEGYSGNEVLISAAGEVFPNPERAKGLKPVYPGGTDNTGIGVSVTNEGSTLGITCLLAFTMDREYSFRVPENLMLDIESGCENANNITITGMLNEIVVKNCNDIDIKDASGPVVLSSISGNVTVNFRDGSFKRPSSINTFSGDIDVSLPAKTSADVYLSSMSGNFYSDFEITLSKDNLRQIGGRNMEFSLNGGGPKISIVAISGNIYLRKAN